MNKTLLFLFFITLSLHSFAQNINQTDTKGLRQGIWQKKYPNGKLMYQGNFKDNYPIGEMKRYHKNGILKAILLFSEQGKKAKAQLFNTKKRLVAKGNFIQNKKDSVWIYFDSNQNIRFSETYQNGLKSGETKYFFQNKNISEIITFDKNIKNGSWKRFFREGKIYFAANYKNGKLNGSYQSFYRSGRLEIDGIYKNNKRNGKWDYYSDRGKLLFTIDYIDGIASNQEELDKAQLKKLQNMEAQKNRFEDPAHQVNDPDAYLNSFRK
jgi:antitoxin component YwqK of YwqJK toxin-antitoxin module